MDIHHVLPNQGGLNWQGVLPRPNGVCLGIDANHIKMGVTPHVFEHSPEGKVQMIPIVSQGLQHTYHERLSHLLPNVQKNIGDQSSAHHHHVVRPQQSGHGFCKCILCNAKHFSKEEELILKYGSLANVSNSPPNNPAAVKENTYPLRVWLEENRENPYPTKSEKLMLSIVTKMTLTQVSTWFANARRRLKKERKMDVDFTADFLPLTFPPTHQAQFLGGTICHPRRDMTHSDPNLPQPQVPVIGNQNFTALNFSHNHLHRVPDVSKKFSPPVLQPAKIIEKIPHSKELAKEKIFKNEAETNRATTEIKPSFEPVTTNNETAQKSKAIWSIVETANSSQ